MKPVTNPTRYTSKDIAKAIRDHSGRHSHRDLFADWVEAMAMALANSQCPRFGPQGEERDRREAIYMKLVKKHSPETMSLFAQWMGMLQIAHREHREPHGSMTTFADVLGNTFEQLELMNENAGQFFTPSSVSEMMARLEMDPGFMRERLMTARYLTVNDPACGSGRTLLGAVNAVVDAKIDHTHHLLVYGEDVGWKCVCMTYVTMSMLGVPAVISHQNTLTMEVWSRMATPVYWLRWHWFQRQERVVVDDVVVDVTGAEGPLPEPKADEKNPDQWSLF